MNRNKIKKSLLVVLASLAVVFQSGCASPEQNVKKAVEVPMEDLGEEPPVTPETEENANIGDQQEPKPQAEAEEPSAQETMNPEPPPDEEEEKEDPDSNHPEPPPGEEYADGETEDLFSAIWFIQYFWRKPGSRRCHRRGFVNTAFQSALSIRKRKLVRLCM